MTTNLKIAPTADELEQWAAARETSEIVAHAIHAIASAARPADAVWDDPTAAEIEQVKSVVRELAQTSRYESNPEVAVNRFNWGVENFQV